MPTLRTQLVLDDMKHLKDEFVMLVYAAATIVCTSLTGCWSLDVARWDNLSVSIAEGDTVTLTCRSPTPERRTRGSLGLVQGEDRGVGMVPLWDSGLQGEAVNRRYRITYRVSGPKSVLRLTIRDARREDSGSYGCLLNSDERTASYMTLNVLEGQAGPQRTPSISTRTARNKWTNDTRGGWIPVTKTHSPDFSVLKYLLPGAIVGLMLLILICIVERLRRKARQRAAETFVVRNYSLNVFNPAQARATTMAMIETENIRPLGSRGLRSATMGYREVPHSRRCWQVVQGTCGTSLEADCSAQHCLPHKVAPSATGDLEHDLPSYEDAVNSCLYPKVERETLPELDPDSPPAYSTLADYDLEEDMNLFDSNSSISY